MPKDRRNTLQDFADEDLIALTQRGELAAFDLLYERHKRAAYSLARRIVGGDGAAEDVVQETFISVWRSIERYDPTRASVRTWLLRIVHRRAIDALRSRLVHLKRRADGEGLTDELESAEPGPATVAVHQEEARGIRVALDELPEDQRNVIELAYFGGFTHSEIAEMVGTPLGTVKGRMRLGLEKMRLALDESGATAQGG
ncbi:MAG TPA: sigma-70 family RNA polymerase sigma factor [Solirubrobacterales bacterium]|jgi:RNA polymerase sigma-70 factor (ECF subfamily)|nr:sigma-70 family RNA polymerase sigma factor [Solirubrobacterales bacterium]